VDGSLRRSLHTPPTSAGRQSDVEPKMTTMECRNYKLDESVNVQIRQRVGSLFASDSRGFARSAKRTAASTRVTWNRRLKQRHEGYTMRAFKSHSSAACNCTCNVVHLYNRKLGTLWKVFPTRHRVAAQTLAQFRSGSGQTRGRRPRPRPRPPPPTPPPPPPPPPLPQTRATLPCSTFNRPMFTVSQYSCMQL
jgi:hypothetical protein